MPEVEAPIEGHAPKPLESAELLGSVEPLESAEQLGSVEPRGSVDSLGPVEPLGPEEPLRPVEPVEPVRSAEPPQPRESAAPLDSVMSVMSVRSIVPVEPLGPTEPTEPLESVGLAGPVGLAEPVELTGPVEVAEPGPRSVAKPIRLVLVDDHRLFRSGVRTELVKAAGKAIEFVGEAADVPSAVRVIESTRPQVVLLDVHLPGGGGVAVLNQCLERMPEVRFLALSVSDAAQDVIGVIRAGARGYVRKSIAGARLVDAVRKVAEGDVFFSPRLAGFVLDAFSGRGPADTPDEELDRLTVREREVLRLIARGFAYKEIARELVISARTVEVHVSSVLRKLQLSNRYELSRWAARRRIG